ncbi:hypothetical protein BD289DRAFT_118215 [Coniella lustricola]|uniref:ABC transporter n=1 Tax=Coniella lustricola TaxID=2025994 RepID=A0A2T2ZWV8_9PEZI|nr:hypothetical protein BD289DRAFT_118215 [Coniella lustricola]
MSFLGCAGDSAFGPAVQGCRADFDFTLKFERIVLGLIPAAIFVAIAVPRIAYLSGKPGITTGFTLRSLKSTTIVAYAVIQLAILALSASHGAGNEMRSLIIATATLAFVSTAAMLVMSWLEHSRSLRPSMLLTGYLTVTILCDAAQVRTLWLISSAGTYQEIIIVRLSTAALAVKAVLTILESWQKTSSANRDDKTHSPEETAGLLGLGAFFWLNRLFLVGYKQVLTLEDLFPLDYNMTATRTGERLDRFLQDKKFHGQKHGLMKALAKSLVLAISLPVAPRMALLGFTFCQPFLINSILSYLEQSSASRDQNVGYGLVGATVIVFFGMAITNAFYWYFHERSLWMARSALASVIYQKTIEMKTNTGNDSAAVTLMSTDVEKIRSGAIILHEFWANFISSALASYLLYRELGIAFIAPILTVAACTAVTFFVATFTGKRQKLWMEKIQVRVGMTANVIAQMKNIKIAGFALPVESLIQNLRLQELQVGGGFRMIICWSVLLSYFPSFVAPVVTLAWTSKTLTVTRMFTSYAYLFLLADPLVGLFQGVPMVMGAVASLSRIQAFLEAESRDDPRLQAPSGLLVPTTVEKSAEKAQTDEASVDRDTTQDSVVTIAGGSFGWTAGISSLSEIDVQVPAGQLTVVVGPVASGKSTFCKALLGEVPYTLKGRVALVGNSALRRKIGYCDQAPFLTNGTIRQNIIGYSAFDQNRYDEVIEAAMLRSDFLVNFPQGDATKIGSNGISLSGGQKQRVSIARALYLDTDFFIFDDVLSGLDADTSEQVFWRVFGPNGVIKRRNATVVLCTHSIKHLPSADHVIALGANGRIVEQGTFEDLVANKDYIYSLGVKTSSTAQDLSPSNAGSEEDGSSSVTQEQPQIEKAIVASSSPVDNGSRMNGDRVVYKHYYRSIGFWPLAIFTCFVVTEGFFWNWQTIWINFWSSDVSSSHPSHADSYYLGLFGLFQILGLVMLFAEVYVCMQTMVRVSGATLHKAALSTTIMAPLRFFTTTDNGVITNLFSQDMTLVDSDLPLAMINTATCLLVSAGMAAVVATSAPYLAISYPFLCAVLWLIQNFYLKTSRQLRLLDLEAKSPL